MFTNARQLKTDRKARGRKQNQINKIKRIITDELDHDDDLEKIWVNVKLMESVKTFFEDKGFTLEEAHRGTYYFCLPED